MDIKIQLDDAEVQRGLNRLVTAGSDLSPAMRVIATQLADRAEASFQTEAAPGGAPWPKLKPSTVRDRTRLDHAGNKMLQRSGALVRSILADWGPATAVAGTNVPYARTHQFGAKKGQFGTGSYKTRDGSFPIPWGDIPARPFLGVSPGDAEKIKQTLLEFIAERWR